MFRSSVFDQPIGDWDVSKVTNMDFMFQTNSLLSPLDNQDLSRWCVELISESGPTAFGRLESGTHPNWGAECTE